MITFLRLGEKGNLGNQLFQIASSIGIADKNGHQYSFPAWKYSEFLERPLPVLSEADAKNWTQIKEKQFSYYDWKLGDGNYNLEGWLQTEKYFQEVDIKHVFKFKKHFQDDLKEKFKYLFSRKTILITIRRGDFVDNKYYFQTSYKYYFSALLKHFPDFEDYNIIFTSDDPDYCKYHFQFLKNAYFLEGLSAIEQMALASLFDHFIISNSTFSWWVAWLGEKENTKVVCPIRNFDGPYRKIYDETDYYCERWNKHDENSFSIPSKYISLTCCAFRDLKKKDCSFD